MSNQNYMDFTIRSKHKCEHCNGSGEYRRNATNRWGQAVISIVPCWCTFADCDNCQDTSYAHYGHTADEGVCRCGCREYKG